MGVARDDRGAAALEGIIVLAALVGVFFAVLLIGQWGSGVQRAQMGARLLAFDAGDVNLAKLGRASNQPVQTVSSTRWDTLFNYVTADWLGGMFALSNDHFAGSVTGSQQGRQPGNSPSLFDYQPTTMNFNSRDWSAAANAWGMNESIVGLTFINISYYVGRYRVTPDGLDSTNAMTIPSTIPVLETIYARVGIR